MNRFSPDACLPIHPALGEASFCVLPVKPHSSFVEAPPLPAPCRSLCVADGETEAQGHIPPGGKEGEVSPIVLAWSVPDHESSSGQGEHLEPIRISGIGLAGKNRLCRVGGARSTLLCSSPIRSPPALPGTDLSYCQTRKNTHGQCACFCGFSNRDLLVSRFPYRAKFKSQVQTVLPNSCNAHPAGILPAVRAKAGNPT